MWEEWRGRGRISAALYKLDHQPGFVAVEVGDERSELLLSAELEAQDLPSTYKLPEDLLRRGLPLPQLASQIHKVRKRKPSPHEITERRFYEIPCLSPPSPGRV